MITPAFNLTATERVLPRMALDFTTGVLDPRVTITRALNTATRVNSSGLIEIINANLPRFDYDPVTLAPKGLMIEEQRTNLLLNSSGFTSATWTKSLSAMAGTFTTAPDGTNTGAKWREDNTLNEHAIYATPSLTAALHTETWYLKAAERTKVQVSLATAGLAYGASVIADLSAGTLSAVTNRGIHTGATATIISAGNGWYRVSLTITATAATYYPALTLVTGTNTTNYLGDGTSGIFIWGAQVETGGFATSYIPTVASLVTRSADNVAMTGTNFSSWYNQTEGAFVADFDKYSTTSRGGILCAGNISGGSGSGITLDGQNDGKVRAFIENAGSLVMSNLTLANYAANTPIKGAIAYATNNAVGAAAGALGTVDTSVAVPTVDNLQIGAIRNSTTAAVLPLNGHIRSISYYIIRVLNAELQAFSK